MITPLEDRIALDIEPEDQSAGGIHLVATVDYKEPERAKVVAVGPKAEGVKKGDRVLIVRGAGTGNDVEDGRKTYRMVRMEHVLAVLR